MYKNCSEGKRQADGWEKNTMLYKTAFFSAALTTPRFLAHVYQFFWLRHGTAAGSGSAPLPLHVLFGLKRPRPAFLYISDTNTSSSGLCQKLCCIYKSI